MVFNRTRAKAKEFKEKGVPVAGSVQELSASSPIIITMLPDEPTVEEVIRGEGGILSGALPGTTVIDMSTVSPSFSRKMHEYVRLKGLRFLDAPVSGSIRPAEEGTLIIMVGGEKEVFEECKPIFQALGKDIFYLGGRSGMGASMKLVANLLLVVFMSGTADALFLAQKEGLTLEQVAQVLSSSVIISPSLKAKFPLFLKEQYEPISPSEAYEEGPPSHFRHGGGIEHRIAAGERGLCPLF
jgi:3-hydroxyisobutyrate dehydrogenase-like beta-hydroxyacid dehydrogenase